jgi:hypothetical protein
LLWVGFIRKLSSLSVSKGQNGLAAEDICLACGLCCNGVIFADVKLLPEENVKELLSLRMPLLRARAKRGPTSLVSPAKESWKFLQPCAAHDGCRCRIYSARPRHCREFDCLLLKKVQEGAATRGSALRIIRAARRQAEKVRALLVALGDTEESVSLAQRFRNTRKRLEQTQPDKKAAGLYSQLTVAFHKLSILIGESFYPAPR